jgi:hypothetical protein
MTDKALTDEALYAESLTPKVTRRPNLAATWIEPTDDGEGRAISAPVE